MTDTDTSYFLEGNGTRGFNNGRLLSVQEDGNEVWGLRRTGVAARDMAFFGVTSLLLVGEAYSSIREARDKNVVVELFGKEQKGFLRPVAVAAVSLGLAALGIGQAVGTLVTAPVALAWTLVQSAAHAVFGGHRAASAAVDLDDSEDVDASPTAVPVVADAAAEGPEPVAAPQARRAVPTTAPRIVGAGALRVERQL